MMAALSPEHSNALAASTETRQDAFSCRTSSWHDVPDAVVTDIPTVRNRSLFLYWSHPVQCCTVATGHVWSCVFTLTCYQQLLNIFLARFVFLLYSSGYSCPQLNITAIFETSNIFLLVMIVWLYTAFFFFFESESNFWKSKKKNTMHCISEALWVHI